MAPCHHLSRGWLLTDARLAGHGIAAARHLPPFSVILVRSDALPPRERRRLVLQLRRIARARRLRVLMAGVSPDQARRLGVDGIHLRDRSARRAVQARRLGLTTSAPVHDGREARAAARARIDHALISPLFATQSHPGAPTLSVRRFAQLARLTLARLTEPRLTGPRLTGPRLTGAGAIALGGMTPARHRQLRRRSSVAATKPEWAAIDAWDTLANRPQRQKRNCVPT